MLFVSITGACSPAGDDTHQPRVEAKINPLAWAELRKLTANDPEDSDNFGTAVAVSGDLVLVGTPTKSSLQGAAYLFSRDLGGPDNWGLVKKLTASDAADGDFFGGSLALDGDFALIGAGGVDGAGSDRGAAYLFSRNEGGADDWGEVKKLTASDGADDDDFGVVALSGDLALVGASAADAGGIDSGAVYVFSRNQGGADNWGEVQKLTPSVVQSGLRFGRAVSLSGEIALVGADEDDTGGINRGSAYVFSQDQGGADNWGEVRRLTAGASGDAVGCDVSVAGDVALVGTCFGEAAYVFSRDQGGIDNWGEVKELIASDSGDGFGRSVALWGGYAVVGALEEDGDGTLRGAAYGFFQEEGGIDNWGEITRIVASDAEDQDRFGFAVAVHDRTAVVTARWEDGAGENYGAAYVQVLKQGNGGDCTIAADCASGSCVDMICCDSDCTGPCRACTVAAGATTDGTCEWLTGTSCNDGLYCNGSDTCSEGTCTHAGDPCEATSEDRDNDCAESCDEASQTCTAADPDGARCDDGIGCTAPDRCSGGVCVPEGNICGGGLGSLCLEQSECGEGTCVDLVCCSQPTCGAYTCGPDGDCLTACAGDHNCSDGYTCSAARQCVPEDGGAGSGGGCGCGVPGREISGRARGLALLLLAISRLGRRRR